MVEVLGGPNDFLDRYESYLAVAPVTRAVHAQGVVTGVDTRAMGNAIIELGGGRRQVGEKLDLSVGFSDIAPIGTHLDAATPLAIVHAASENAAEQAQQRLLEAVTLGDSPPAERPVVYEILTG